MLLPVGDNIQKNGLPAASIGLIVLNTLIFIFQFASFVGDDPQAVMEAEMDFLMTFGLVPGDFTEGQVLGLVTYMFLHGGWMHLIGNMVVLWAFAPALEQGWGRWSFLGFYGLFGLAGGLAHVFMNLGSLIPMVGASGAIAGLIGAYTVMYGPTSKIKMMFIFFFRPFFFQLPALVFGIGWIFLQLLNASDGGNVGGGVAWWAHIGGFAAGAFIAFVCRNETNAKLIDEGNGELRLVDNEELAVEILKRSEQEQADIAAATRARAELDPAALNAPPVQIPACPHCATEYQEADLISDSLARCPNSDCGRLIYLTEPLKRSTRDPAEATTNGTTILPSLDNPATSQPISEHH